jgi:solute carrier family 25 oxoglutarate transporter 11
VRYCWPYLKTNDIVPTARKKRKAFSLFAIALETNRTRTRTPAIMTESKTPSTIAKTLQPFVCGGAAATSASIVIHPIDLAKVRMQLYGQMNPGKPIPSFPSLLSSMVKRDGLLSVYKGVDAAIGRQMVYGTARIGLHRTFSDKLVELNDGNPISFVQKALSGMASGSIAVCIGTPFDIALVRLQSDGMAPPEARRNYANVFDALIRTSREEGISALYKGLLPNILRGMSMNVGMMACYDQAKETVASLLGDPMIDGPSLPTRLGASATAGFTAALFSLPFDLVKSRLMAQKPDPMTGKMPYKGIRKLPLWPFYGLSSSAAAASFCQITSTTSRFTHACPFFCFPLLVLAVDCTIQIAKKEGPRGFFSGFSAYYTRCGKYDRTAVQKASSSTTSLSLSTLDLCSPTRPCQS